MYVQFNITSLCLIKASQALASFVENVDSTVVQTETFRLYHQARRQMSIFVQLPTSSNQTPGSVKRFEIQTKAFHFFSSFVLSASSGQQKRKANKRKDVKARVKRKK